MTSFRRLARQLCHGRGQRGRPIGKTPGEPDYCGQQDRDADRFVELIELEQLEGIAFDVRHRHANACEC